MQGSETRPNASTGVGSSELGWIVGHIHEAKRYAAIGCIQDA